MGCKAVKEHFNIAHVVHMRNGNLCIGSSYISELIVLTPDGRVLTGAERALRDTGELGRYVREIQADIPKFCELLAQEDTISAPVPVYIAVDGKVVCKYAEKVGWPYVTLDGELQYNNTHFATEEQAAERGKASAVAAIQNWRRGRAELLLQLLEADAAISGFEQELATLNARYPEVSAPTLDEN